MKVEKKKGSWLTWLPSALILPMFVFNFINLNRNLHLHDPAYVDNANQCTAQGVIGRYSAAIPHCQASVDWVPDSAQAHYELGRYLVLDGQTKAGLKECAKAVELKPTPSRYANLAMAQALNNEGDRALKTLQPALADIEDHPGRYAEAGMVYYSLGNRKMAVDCWRKASTRGLPIEKRLAREFMKKYK